MIAFMLGLIFVAVLLCSKIGRSILLLTIVSLGGLWLFFGN